MKKIAIIIFITLIISLIMLLIYNKNRMLIIPIKEKVEVYSDISLKDLIDESISIIDDFNIDTSTLGVQKIDVKYKNKIFTYKDTININIVDNEPPIILVNDIKIEKGTNIDLVNRFLCGDNYDVKPSCYIEGNYNIDEIGEYNLKYVAVDSSNNKTEKSFILKVKEKEKQKIVEDNFTDFKDILEKYKTRIGIDVSKWQGDIDFEAVKNTGCEFVIIKAAGSHLDGEIYVDPRFKKNIEDALKNNLQVGVYFNSNSNSVQKSQEEIDFLLDLIKDYSVDFVAYDWENFSDFNLYNISIHDLNEMANVFLNKSKDNGYKPLLYSSKYYLENIWNVDYDTWVAQYSSINTYEGDYIMWQLCSDGIIDGINSYVDIDVMYEK